MGEAMSHPRRFTPVQRRRRGGGASRRRGLLPSGAIALLAGGLLAAGAAPPTAAAGTGIYRYIDAEGVVHFSDTPHDARYRPLEKLPPELALSRPARAEAPAQHVFDALIARTARDCGVDPALVKAVVAAESNFEIEAVSRVGAQGLMQLMPATAAELGVESPFQPLENLKGGVRYLKQMLDRYGDVERALAAYNAGPSAVDRHGGIPPYRETQAYVKRVLKYYRGYQGHFPR
jgi:soluble lytic murein transglycosylase